MKKLLLLLTILFTLASCSLDNENTNSNFHVEFVPVTNVELPEYVIPGYTYPLKLYYSRPTDCFVFDGFAYEIDKDNARVVALQFNVFEQDNCEPIQTLVPEVATLTFECPPVSIDTVYTFKFYVGTDANGNQQFLEKRVPIAQ